MAMATITLATVGVLSAILGILFQNGNLVKVWRVVQDTYMQTASPSAVRANIRNTSYQLLYQEAKEQRLENMQKYDFPHNQQGVDRRSKLSLEEFVDVYDGKWPVLITDVVPKWKASNWTAEFFLEQFGDDRVTMRAVDGSLKDGRGLSLPLSLFLQNRHKSHPSMWTYLEDELFVATRPALKADIGRCRYLEQDFFDLLPESVAPWNAMMLWGTAFSRSSLHIDPYNWTGTNAVISGNKRWKLFPPGQDHLLYVTPGKHCGFPLDCKKYNSEVDSFSVDESRYPLFSRAQFLEFEQKPGELLVIPTGWFHQAYNTEVTLAISSQVMNSQNFLVVLEEILKGDNLKRSDLPLNMAQLSPKQQVEAVAAALSPAVLARGKAVTQKMLKDIQHHQRD